MKKLSLFLCAVIGIAIFALAGCSGYTYTEKSYQSDNTAIENIIIDVEDRKLEFSESEDSRIHIDYYDNNKEYLEITDSENILTVKLVYDKEWTDYIGSKPSAEYRKIEIKIPKDTIASLSATTTNEDVSVTSLSFTESLKLNSNGGNVVLERTEAGNSIDLTAKNGDITGSIIGSMDDFSIKCTIKKGDCNLPTSQNGGSKSLSANCNNGDIHIEFVN